MKNIQNYNNHVRFDGKYHFLQLPLSKAVLILSAVLLFRSVDLSGAFYFLAGLSIFLLTFIIREYAKKNQDRIIRMEMRLRYYLLTGKNFAEIEPQLTNGQLVALRFASDKELTELIRVAIKENLSSKEIKKRIQDWQGDFQRIQL